MTASTGFSDGSRYASISRLICIVLTCIATSWAWGGALEEEFKSPPNSAQPRVWWNWMNGNVTAGGIRADLLWLKRIGIGGLQNKDVGLDTPALVDKPIDYLSPRWKDAFRSAASLASEQDLEFGIFSSPGWSLTGGPWVKPQQSMKKLVWSETRVRGGQLFNGKLPDLPVATGPFQNTSLHHGGTLIAWDSSKSIPEFSQDAVVIAYREPARDTETPAPRVTSNANVAGTETGTTIDDVSNRKLPDLIDGKPPSIQLAYDKPLQVRSATVAVSPPGSVVNLAVSMDGKKFKHFKTFYIGGSSQVTASFEPVTARFFRFTLLNPKPQGQPFSTTSAPGVSLEPARALLNWAIAPPPLVVHSLHVHPGARVNRFEQKAGFEIAQDYYTIATPPVPPNLSIPVGDVVDLTELMRSDGTLQWSAPPGNWVILRMGYSLTGSMNHAASRAGTGLEVDKLNQRHVQQYIDDYLKLYSGTVGSKLIGAHGLNAFTLDSFEVGAQNWTDDILEQFARLRGYDPTPWLPSLTGVVVGSAGGSDKFLWDFRRTLGDLLVENHYRTIARTVAEHGLTLYGEALESLRASLGDDMAIRRYTDIPMAALWMFRPGEQPAPGYLADIRGAASVAHVYGQNLVAAESFTTALAPWALAPRDLKPVIDLAFALGVNRPVIHASVHQPLNNMLPGISLNIFGQDFTRHDTWAELATGWIDYLSRCSYMLQQGQYVADIAYFYGEEAPLVSLFGTTSPPEIPQGYSFDFINADGILHQLTVNDGGLVTPSGMRYRVLYMGGSSAMMTLPVLRKIQSLVAAGGVIVGKKPLGSPSLADDPEEFRRLADEVWGADHMLTTEPGSPQSGRVFRGADIGAALAKLNIVQDFAYQSTDPHVELLHLHRRIPDGHIYFVSNRAARKASAEATFRVAGLQAEIWHPDTGEVEKASYRISTDRTTVPLALDPYQSLFVVFRLPTRERVWTKNASATSEVSSLADDWHLSIPSQGAAPAYRGAIELGSWSDMKSVGIEYFSGTGTYTREIIAADNWFAAGSRLILDLGDVRELAQISVNGQSLGILWKPPYRVDITDALRPGTNQLEVRVTNLWVNRLIGDQQPGVIPVTSTSTPTYSADAPLRASGLIGPVTIKKQVSP